MASSDAIEFGGRILAVKGRIRLIRSFDQVSHQYQGYSLIIASEDGRTVRLALGPTNHAKHQLRIGDLVSGKAHAVPDPTTEWADLYRVSGFAIHERGPESKNRPPTPRACSPLHSKSTVRTAIDASNPGPAKRSARGARGSLR